jgi:hypothetical protein
MEEKKGRGEVGGERGREKTKGKRRKGKLGKEKESRGLPLISSGNMLNRNTSSYSSPTKRIN